MYYTGGHRGDPGDPAHVALRDVSPGTGRRPECGRCSARPDLVEFRTYSPPGGSAFERTHTEAGVYWDA